MIRPILLLPIASAALIVGGIAVALWMAGSASGERDRFSSLEIAPADTDVFFAFNTEPTSPQWLAVNDSLEDVNAKGPIREALDEFLAEVNLDWEEDILPVAGDEAFLSIPDVTEVSNDTGVVAGFRIRNTDKAQEVFDSLRERSVQEGEELTEEEYEGVTIYYTESAPIEIEDPFEGEDPFEDEDDANGEEGDEGDEPFDFGPFDDTFFECLDYSFGGDNEDETIPTECEPYFDCPLFGLDAAAPDEDSDSDGVPDTCEEFDFFGDDDGSFEIFPDDADDGEFEAVPIESDEDLESTSSQSDDLNLNNGAVALFDGVLAIGSTPDDVKAVIDVVQGRAESAETNERLQEFRELQKEDFLMWGYTDLAPVWDMAEESFQSDAFGGLEEESPFDPQEIIDEARGTYDRVGFSISSMDAGFAFDLTVLHAEDFDPEFRFEPTEAFDSEFAGRVPASTMFFFAGYDIYGQNIEPALETLNEIDFGDGQNFQDFLDDFAEETGVDIQSELLAQLTGEWAVAADVADFEDPDVNVLALVEFADTNRAEQALRDLGDYLEEQEAITTEETDGVHQWSEFDTAGGPGLTWTIADADFVGGYPATAVEGAESGFDDSLADNDDWKRTMDLLPGDKTFVGFISLARVLEEARKLPDAEAEFLSSTDGELSLDDLAAIRSIGMSGTSRDNGFGFHAVLFLAD